MSELFKNQAWSESDRLSLVRLLTRILTSLVTPPPSPTIAPPLIISELIKADSLNRCGTLLSECWGIVSMATNAVMSGPLATTATIRKKPTRDLHGLESSPVPPPATSSTRSIRKRAKPARTGGKSKVQYHSGALTRTREKQLGLTDLRSIRSGRQSKIIPMEE